MLNEHATYRYVIGVQSSLRELLALTATTWENMPLVGESGQSIFALYDKLQAALISSEQARAKMEALGWSEPDLFADNLPREHEKREPFVTAYVRAVK